MRIMDVKLAKFIVFINNNDNNTRLQMTRRFVAFTTKPNPPPKHFCPYD